MGFIVGLQAVGARSTPGLSGMASVTDPWRSPVYLTGGWGAANDEVKKPLHWLRPPRGLGPPRNSPQPISRRNVPPHLQRRH